MTLRLTQLLIYPSRPSETGKIMVPPTLRCPASRGMLVDFPFESAPNVNLIFSGIAWGTRGNEKDGVGIDP